MNRTKSRTKASEHTNAKVTFFVIETANYEYKKVYEVVNQILNYILDLPIILVCNNKLTA